MPFIPSAALLTATSAQIATNVQTGDYTLVGGDAYKIVEMTKATATSLTVPENASVSFAIGTSIGIFQYGLGQVTIVAAGAAVIRSPSGLRLVGQYSSATLRKRAADEWVLTGDLTS